MYPRILLTIAASAVTANAAVFSPNPVSFTINQAYGAVTASNIDPLVVFNSSFLTASLPAFDTTLGTLESFTVTWSLSGIYAGTLSTGGGVSSAYSGPFLINAIAAPLVPTTPSTPGGGGGGGNGPGVVLTLPFTTAGNPLSFAQTFNVTDAGTLYDQEILDAVTGSGPVSHNWNTPLTISGNWSDLTVTGNASAAISYTYTIPEASTFAVALSALGFSCFRRRRL